MLIEKIFRNLVGAIVLGDFFSDKKDVWVSLNLFVHGLVECISVGEFDLIFAQSQRFEVVQRVEVSFLIFSPWKPNRRAVEIL